MSNPEPLEWVSSVRRVIGLVRWANVRGASGAEVMRGWTASSGRCCSIRVVESRERMGGVAWTRRRAVRVVSSLVQEERVRMERGVMGSAVGESEVRPAACERRMWPGEAVR